MEKEATIFQKNSNGKLKFIEFSLKNETLERKWGVVGGKFQTKTSSYKGLNIGKSNELTPEQVAYEDFLRILNKKKKEGYSTDENQETKDIDWSKINSSFCCSKPISKPDKKVIKYSLKRNIGLITKKYNGLCHYILITDTGEVKIYTRRIIEHTRKYPEIVKMIEDRHLPNKSIFICEFMVKDDDHLEAFRKISKISKIDTLKGELKEDLTESFKRQKKNPVYCVCFGVLYWEGEPVWKNWEYKKHLEIMNKCFCEKRLMTPEVFYFSSLFRMTQFLKEKKKSLEGFVFWELRKKLEVTLNGKPKRRAAYKIKVTEEDDFIAFGWQEGKTKGKIGALKFGKMKNNKIFQIGTVGSGLKNDDLDPNTWNFPCVIVIEYANKFSTGKLQHPVFVCKHGDKTPEEIIEE